MKKLLLAIGLIAVASQNINAQIIDTVSIGAGYANHKFYSLHNDEQGTASKDNWDLGFEITGISSAILANTQRANFALYRAPYSINNYNTIDTTGIKDWTILQNSDTTWNVGAFNSTTNFTNAYDLGWGVYDLNTHYVNGDSCYVVKLSATSYKKLKIVSLIGGTYNFVYANIDGTSSQTATISKSNFTGKNFAYFDLTTNGIVDREPASANWDLMFGRYNAFIPSPYPVTGVLANKGVKIAQLDNVANPASFNAWPGHGLSSNISTIGHDWKSVDILTSGWRIVGDTIFLVQDKTGNMWKLRFTGFGGSANGNYIFSKEKLSAVGLADINGQNFAQVALYPNPAIENTTLVFSTEKSLSNLLVSVLDITGKVISYENLHVESGLNKYEINTAGLNNGLYLISISSGSYKTIQKLIKQ